MKLSKKQLVQLAEKLGGKKFTGNVYSYENIVYYIELLARGNRNGYDGALKQVNQENKEGLEKLLMEILAVNCDWCKVQQLAYSVGVYGNNGQLHEIMLLRDNKEVKTIYLYY